MNESIWIHLLSFSVTHFRLACTGKINYTAAVLLSPPIVCFIFRIRRISLCSLQIELIEMAEQRLKPGERFITFALFSLSRPAFSYLDVLSAAHCVHGVDRKNIKIYIGGHNITTDYVDTRRVARIFEHEYFDSVSFDFDIAILELSKPVEFGPKIQPACLPQSQFQDYSGKTALIAGWGRLGMVMVFF